MSASFIYCVNNKDLKKEKAKMQNQPLCFMKIHFSPITLFSFISAL